MKGIAKAINDIDKPLFIITIVLFGLGLLNIVTASSQAAVLRYNSALYSYFYRQLINIILGCIVGIFIIKTPSKAYKLFGPLAFIIVAITSLAVSLTSYGATYSGNDNWINIHGFTFQPSEFAKPAMIVWLAILFEKFYKKLKTKNINHYDMIAKILFVGCFFPIIIFIQKDYGTMFVISTIFAVLFLSSPILKVDKLKTIGLGIVLFFIVLIMFISNSHGLLSNAQKSRFNFFNPCEDYENGGYQICNGFIAINSGGLFGNGIGNSKQISYIPESHTDSVFAIIAEQYGLWMTTIIFILYLLLLNRILKISKESETIRGRYITLGISIYIFLHILINLGGLFGIMPLTGIPLPFLSYGGSFTISLVCSLAIVQRISIENKNRKIKLK